MHPEVSGGTGASEAGVVGATQPSTTPPSADVPTTQPGTMANSRSETMQIAENLPLSPTEGLRDEPDLDYYLEARWFVRIVDFTLCATFVLSYLIIVYTAVGAQMALWIFYPPPGLWWTWTPLSLLSTLGYFILFAIAFESFKLLFEQTRFRDCIATVLNSLLFLHSLLHLTAYGIGLPTSSDVEIPWYDTSGSLSYFFLLIPGCLLVGLIFSILIVHWVKSWKRSLSSQVR